VRAALAGGLVFGLGAGLTVASWTDAARVHSPALTASVFGIEVKAGSGSYSGLATSVTVNVTGVYPGTTGAVYLPILVRTTAGSVAGTVSFAHPASGASGLAPVLRYRVVRSASCAASAFTGSPTWVVGDASTFPLVTTAQPAVAGPAVAANGGSEAAYCVEFTLPTGLTQATYQGTSAAVTFTLTGTSS
jgi:hypothetical protein